MFLFQLRSCSLLRAAQAGLIRKISFEKVVWPLDMAPKKREQGSTQEVIPAKRPKPQPAKQPPHPWTEPDSLWTGAAEKQMRQLIPHLHKILPIVLRGSKLPECAAVTDLLQLPPLEIKGGSDKGQSSAFAALAICSCEMYEAAGVLWWLHTFPQENDAQTQHIQWDDVVAYSDRLCQLVKGKVVTATLIPCYVWAQDADKLELESSFPSGLNVVGPALLPLWGLLFALMREVTRAQGSRDFEMVRDCSVLALEAGQGRVGAIVNHLLP